MLADADQSLEPRPEADVPACKVIIPRGLATFFAEHGYAQTIDREARNQARLRVRTYVTIRFQSAPLSLLRESPLSPNEAGTAILKDLSRSGLGLLYHRQVFPKEVLWMFFQNRCIEAVAVRCRRVGTSCYETGCEILSVRPLNDATD